MAQHEKVTLYLPSDQVEALRQTGNMSARVSELIRRSELAEAGEQIQAWRGTSATLTDGESVELVEDLAS